LDEKRKLGANILQFVEDHSGIELAQRMRAKEKGVRLPKHFWRAFVEDSLHLEYTTCNRLRCHRALLFTIMSFGEGKTTARALRDGEKSKASRMSGGEKNAMKAYGLGWHVLQFFIDEIQQYKSRADSVMLMERARTCRQQLIANGFAESTLPKLDGDAGKHWLARWRKEYKISKRVNGLQLKVAWRKVLRRCRVLLTNIYRVRAFWEILHPGGHITCAMIS